MLSISFWLQKEPPTNQKETRWVVSFLLIVTIFIAVVSTLNNSSSDDINDKSFLFCMNCCDSNCVTVTVGFPAAPGQHG